MSSYQHPTITAVNVLLEPDHTMTARAEAANDRLRTGYDVLDAAPIASWSLTAVGCYYLPWQDLGLAGIAITPTAEMTELQRRHRASCSPISSHLPAELASP